MHRQSGGSASAAWRGTGSGGAPPPEDDDLPFAMDDNDGGSGSGSGSGADEVNTFLAQCAHAPQLSMFASRRQDLGRSVALLGDDLSASRHELETLDTLARA